MHRNAVTFALAATVLLAAPAFAEDKSPDVLIIGGGLSGLSTAYYCKQAGLSYQVLELTPHVGGRMRSAKYPQGVAAEAGLAEFWEGNPALDLVHALKLPTDRGDTSFSSYYWQNKLTPFVQDTNEEFLAALLTPAERQAYASWDKQMIGWHKEIKSGKPLSPFLTKLKDISFADWMAKHSKLSPKARGLVQAVTEVEFGTGWDRISMLDGIDEWHIFAGKGTGNQHVQGGNQKLGEALADFVGRDRVTVNRQVTNVTLSKDGGDVVAMDPSDYRFHSYHAKHVVTTMPLFRLNEIQFTPPLSTKVREAIDTQTWGAYFTAHIIVKDAAKKYWEQKGESILPILTGGPLGVIYEGETTEGNGKQLINLLVTGDMAEVYNARTGSMDEVKKQLTAAFDKLWPGFTKHVEQMTFVRYHPRAIASWPVGRSRFDALSQEVRKPQGRLYLAGDFTEGTHSDGAVYAAQRVVKQISAIEGKAWTPPQPGH